MFISTDSSGKEKEGEKGEKEEKKIQDWVTRRKEIIYQHVNCLKFLCRRDRIYQASVLSHALATENYVGQYPKLHPAQW